MVQHLKSVRRPVLLGVIALAFLVVAVFLPILGFQFVYLDVRREVIDNPHIQGLTGENLKYILTSRCITSYYPVRTLTYAVDHQLWGLNPRGFKLTNGLIHLANVLLVFWLILRLCPNPAGTRISTKKWRDVSVAAFSAGVFAVHPVAVQPVTWVAGRAELLMTLGVLGCLHCHMTARHLGEIRGKVRPAVTWHAAAACCCAMAALSNAVAAVIPLLITVWDLLTLTGSKFRKILFGTSVLWVIGVATIVIKKLGPEIGHSVGPEGLLSTERLMLVLNVYRLNLKTLLWPNDLALSHSWQIPESFLSLDVILGVIAIALTGVIFWKLRQRKLILFGLVWFALALGPVSHIMPHHVTRADRFLYLPLVGLALAVAMGCGPSVRALKHRMAVAIVIAVAVMGLSVLSILSARQVQTWRDGIHVWENCVDIEPNNSFAHCCLADNLAHAGQFHRAFEEYKSALWLDPEDVQALSNFAWLLATCDDKRLRDYNLAIKLSELACRHRQREDEESLHKSAIVHCAVAADLFRRGEFEGAIQHYETAIDADPDYDLPLFNLASLLTTCPDAELRDADRAVLLAERALKLTEDDANARRLIILAAVYAEAGRFEQAVAIVTKAIPLADVVGDSQLAAELRRRLQLYLAAEKGGRAPN